ncbi:MAG: Hsp20/alpha crystallin family protein [Vulcanimicrobiota bacterium]
MMFRWRPVEDAERMENFVRKFMETATGRTEEGNRLKKSSWSPPVDGWETDDDFHLVFDLPGINKEEISIEVEGEELVVKGERKIDDQINYLRRERVYGPFYRAFSLETPIDRENIKAKYKAGVLEIILPKKEEVKPRQISIDIEEE